MLVQCLSFVNARHEAIYELLPNTCLPIVMTGLCHPDAGGISPCISML
jgi:hypothetical protein